MSGLARYRRYLWLTLLAALALAAGGIAKLDSASAAREHRGPAIVDAPALWSMGTHWVTTWAASPQAAVPGDRAARGFDHQTIRNIVLTSVGGSKVRVRFTNAFGTRPLELGAAAIGFERAGATIARRTRYELSFAGRRSVLIPPGGEALSDAVPLAVLPLQKLAVSVYIPYSSGPATQHVQAQQINYLAAGAHVMTTSGAPFWAQTKSWYFLDSVDVYTPARDLGTVVALGDSITDGVGSGVNTNARWPNDLARRLDSLPGATLGVIDEGIGGNRILNDSPCCGINAMARFLPDVTDQPGAKEVILLEGINDIGFSLHRDPLTAPHTDVSAEQIIAGDEQIIAQAHAAGLKIFGATLTPFKGARYWTLAGEAKRDAVNDWIRTSGAFDGVIDFAGVVADPSDPEMLNPAYDSGDHLHPNAAGYRAMAGAVNLATLLRMAGGAVVKGHRDLPKH